MPRPQRRREDHDAADDRRDPAPNQRAGAAGWRRRACEPDPRQDATRLHSGSTVRVRQAHRGRVPALAAPRRRREPRGPVLEADRRGASARLGGGAGRWEQRRRPGRVTQPSLWRVLEPKWRTALQRIREERSRGGSAKLLILTFVGLAFWVGVFAILYRILKYFHAAEVLEDPVEDGEYADPEGQHHESQD